MSFDRSPHAEELKDTHQPPQVVVPRHVNVVFTTLEVCSSTAPLQRELEGQSLSIQKIEKGVRRATQPIFTVEWYPNTPRLPNSISFESGTDYVIRWKDPQGNFSKSLEHDSQTITLQLKLKVLEV